MSLAPVPVAVRFWEKVDRSGGPDACWPWTKYCDPDGYGRVGTDPGRVELAHRVAWRLTYPGEPMPSVVRHSCDNPPCQNPAHLLDGSQTDNMADMDRRGRRLTGRGERHARAVLTEAGVRELRDLKAQGLSYRAIAAHTGHPQSRVADVLTGRSWKHVS